MKISAIEINDIVLQNLAAEAVELLCDGKLAILAQRFGYALSFDLDAEAAAQRPVRDGLRGGSRR